MRLTAHQPVYLPWLGLIAKIASADAFVSWDAVQFCRRDWHSRNYIKTKDGPLLLTVPVHANGHSTAIRDVRIDNSKPWARKHLKSFEQAYAKAPHAEEHMPFLRWLYDARVERLERLVDLNGFMLAYLTREFGLQPAIATLGDLLEAPRSVVVAGRDATIRDVCKKLDAGTYIFGEQGRDYIDAAAWAKDGIAFEFQSFKHPEYPQLHGEFAPRMCAFDLLMNVGSKRAREILFGESPPREEQS